MNPNRQPLRGTESPDPSHAITRRSLLIAALGAPALASLVAACGDPTTEPAGTVPGTTPGTVPGTVPGTGATGSIEHPVDPALAIIRVSYEGGFVPQGYAFVNLPTLIVAGDGQSFMPGVTTLEFPGPLLAPMNVRAITEAGVQRLLSLADDAGLLAPPPDYTSEADQLVADAPNTVVTISAAGATFSHSAYALGLMGDDGTGGDDESTPARRTLFGFVHALEDLAAVVGAENLGEEAIDRPTEFRLQSYAVTEGDLASFDPAPTIVDWPASTGLDLAAAAECARVSADAAGAIFADADQNSVFRQGDALYRLAVAAVLPGDRPC